MKRLSSRRLESGDLSGLWTGYYAFDLTDEAVMFTAWLAEEDGKVTGTILEESLEAGALETECEADLVGMRRGLDVRFTKLGPTGPDGELAPLRYHGDTDADCCVISGVWFHDDPAEWTGTFMMTRISSNLKARVAVHAANRAGDDRADEG